MTKDEVKELVFQTLGKIFQDNKNKGLISIYLWGSIISPDFSPDSSDIDAVGILSNEANFEQMDRMREWLPEFEPRLKRLQINFLYLDELKGSAPVRSRLARLHNAEQAVFDFPHWEHVVGQPFRAADFPKITPEQALKHQTALTETKMEWALSGKYGDMGLEYFCKGLAWLCYSIHKLTSSPSRFSWSGLENEATDETRELVRELIVLKQKRWNTKAIKTKMPYLLKTAQKLIAKYKT